MKLEDAERLADLLIKRKALDKACDVMGKQEDNVTYVLALAELEGELRIRLAFHASRRHQGIKD